MTTFLMLLFQAAETAAASGDGAAKDGLSVTLDIAALVGALLWPIVLLIVFVIYRKNIPPLVKGIVGRMSKLEFGGISIELAKASEFVPEWNEAVGALDLRSKAEAGQVNDSYMMTFREQLLEEGTWDYAEVDLGDGTKWLTSRLYIMAIVFAQMKGIKALAFVKSSGTSQKHFVCWAEPQKVRWALAKRFPWLEQAYADAYSTLVTLFGAIVVANGGRLGMPLNHADPEPGISLIREFLLRVQRPAVDPNRPDEWVSVNSQVPPPTYEHARWLTSLELEDMLGTDCHRSTVIYDPNSTDSKNSIQALISESGDFVAVVTTGREFKYLARRNELLKQIAK